MSTTGEVVTGMRLVVGISGSTGAIYGVRLMQVLSQMDVETHLIMSRWAEETIRVETPFTVDQVRSWASVVHGIHDMGASISSGSFLTAGMAVVPCSMKTLAAIAHGYSEDLIHRAADVVLKERRKLVVVPRETPLSTIHLENMLTVARAGAVVAPPMPSFYHRPRTIEEIVDHLVSRVLDQFGIEHKARGRWTGMPEDAGAGAGGGTGADGS
jgi:4-hydroxy-3-polyprenylbenzoate decarboxylase